MEVWGVITGVAEEQKIRYFASSKEKAERIAYLENYLYDNENAFPVKLDVDVYDEKMPSLIVFGGYIQFESDKDKDGNNPDNLYVYKFESDEPGYKMMDDVGIKFNKPQSFCHWNNRFYHKYPFFGCVRTVDGESPKDLEKRINGFVFEEFVKNRTNLQNELASTMLNHWFLYSVRLLLYRRRQLLVRLAIKKMTI